MAFDGLGALFGGIILLAYTVQAMTGFGSTVIALSIGIFLYSIDELLPFLVLSNLLFASALVIKFHKGFNKHLAFRVILPGTFVGMLLGYGLKPLIDEVLLKSLLGILIVGISILELKGLFQTNKKAIPTGKMYKQIGPLKVPVLTLASGLSHGMFASGGPLLVYAIAKFNGNKSQFRATVLVCLFSLNVVLTSFFILDGSLQPVVPFVIAAMPIMLLAMKIGNALHHKVDEQFFKKGVYTLLLLMGISLVIHSYQFEI